MKYHNYYFTFGQGHTHRVNGFTWDCDVVCLIQSPSEEEARQKMFDTFGAKWAFCYSDKPEMSYFPRGIKDLNK